MLHELYLGIQDRQKKRHSQGVPVSYSLMPKTDKYTHNFKTV